MATRNPYQPASEYVTLKNGLVTAVAAGGLVSVTVDDRTLSSIATLAPVTVGDRVTLAATRYSLIILGTTNPEPASIITTSTGFSSGSRPFTITRQYFDYRAGHASFMVDFTTDDALSPQASGDLTNSAVATLRADLPQPRVETAATSGRNGRLASGYLDIAGELHIAAITPIGASAGQAFSLYGHYMYDI